MPVDDEQGVVDADRQAEHQRQRRGHRVEVGEHGERDGTREADADAEQGHEQRQPGGDQAAEGDDEHDEGDGQAEHLTGSDQRGVLGDLDAVRGGEAGGGQRRVGRGGDLRPVVDRHRLGVVVELHLHDRVRAVLAHQPGGGGGGGHGLAVLVLGPARGEVGLPFSTWACAVSSWARPDSTWAFRAGRLGSSGLAASSWAISASPPASWPWPSRELRAAGIQLCLAVLELRGRGREVGGALVEAGLRLERVVDPLDVRHGLPRGEHLLGGRALLVGDRRAVGGLQHHGAGAAGRLGDLPAEPVDDLLEGRAGDRDLAGQRLAEGAGEGAEADEQDEPDGQRAPGVGGAPAAEAVQEGGHGGLLEVGRELRRFARRRWRAGGRGRCGRGRSRR